MEHVYCVGREGYDLYFLYRGDPLFHEVFIPEKNEWIESDLAAIYDGEITTQAITQEGANLIVQNLIHPVEAYRNNKYWR